MEMRMVKQYTYTYTLTVGSHSKKFPIVIDAAVLAGNGRQTASVCGDKFNVPGE